MIAGAAVMASPGLPAIGAGAIASGAWPLARVRVAAPARLHLGFLDPSATLGRRFGSLGLVVEGLETVVEIAPSSIRACNRP